MRLVQPILLGHDMLTIGSCVVLVILDVGLILRKLVSVRPWTWLRRSGAPMAEPFVVAAEILAEFYNTFERDLYWHASIGLQPISWKVLGLGDRPNASPIEVLIREQVEAAVEYWQAAVCFDALPRPMRNADQHALEEYAARSYERDARQAVYASANSRREEQAQHYGMLVCRAFFKITSVSAVVPDKLAGLQDVVELIEQFITG